MRTTQELVDKQNALVVKKRSEPMGTQVVMLVDRVVLDENGDAQDRKVGDVHRCRPRYARTLIQTGVACPYIRPAPQVIDAETPEPEDPPFESVKGVSEDVANALRTIGVTWGAMAEMSVAQLKSVPGIGPALARRLIKEAKTHVASPE